MLNHIVHFSVRFRGVVIALACALAGYGVYSLTQAKYDVFPEFAPPMVTIQAEAPGLAPEQVERLVTQPVENAINGVEGIEALRSQSIQGLGLITVTFQSGSDIYRARQVLTERLTTMAGQLPQGVSPPVMSPLDFFHERHVGGRADLRKTFVDGTAHAGGLDDQATASCGVRRGQGDRVRR